MDIQITDGEGRTHRLTDVAAGQSLMEVARLHDIAGLLADCGGACSCATCHVYIDPAWQEAVGPADDIELDMLDMVADVAQPNSRLSCQIALTEALDGLVVTVAPNAEM